MPTTTITCPTCHSPIPLAVTPTHVPGHASHPHASPPPPAPSHPQPARPISEPSRPVPQHPTSPPPIAPLYPPPPPRGITPPPIPESAGPGTRPPYQSRPDAPHHLPPKPHRLTPQATLLSLGVLLLLAAGVTFLAVNWDNLPVTAQAAIIGTLAALALAGSVPTSRRSLSGTAEALAILGTGLLTVDLYAARTLGLISPTATDAPTYTGIVFGSVALITLLMTRLTPKVVTYGVTTVIAAQLPVPLILVDRTSLPITLAALLPQAVATLVLSTHGTPIVRRTGAITASVVFTGILLTGTARTLIDLVRAYSVFPNTDLPQTIATATVVCIAAATGLVILHNRRLPRSIPANLGETICAVAAAFALATTLPQLPGPGRWLTTALATALAITELAHARRTGKLALLLHVSTITVAAVDLGFCLTQDDIRQLGYLAAIVAVLAVLATLRKVVDPVPTATTASLSAQFAVVLFTLDDYLAFWPAAIALAVLAAAGIAVTCRYVGRPLERALISTATCAAVLAEMLAVLTTSPDTATGVVLSVIAAPLVAYGMNPTRRLVLPLAGLLLIIASTAFATSAAAHTLEWYTVPPALIMLAIGILAWRNQPSWVFLGPGLLLGLVPSTLIANSNDTWLRLTLVAAVAVALILLAVRHNLQAPFLIGSAALAKLAGWQFLQVAPAIPRWITLATAGAILLTLGATYEHRLHQAKKAARWMTSLR